MPFQNTTDPFVEFTQYGFRGYTNDGQLKGARGRGRGCVRGCRCRKLLYIFCAVARALPHCMRLVPICGAVLHGEDRAKAPPQPRPAQPLPPPKSSTPAGTFPDGSPLSGQSKAEAAVCGRSCDWYGTLSESDKAFFIAENAEFEARREAGEHACAPFAWEGAEGGFKGARCRLRGGQRGLGECEGVASFFCFFFKFIAARLPACSASEANFSRQNSLPLLTHPPTHLQACWTSTTPSATRPTLASPSSFPRQRTTCLPPTAPAPHALCPVLWAGVAVPTASQGARSATRSRLHR